MKRSILALASGAFILGAAEFVMMGILPQTATAMHVSIPAAGHYISAYAIGVCVGTLILVFGRKVPPKDLIILFMVIALVGNLASAFSVNAAMLVVARFVAGLPHGAFFHEFMGYDTFGGGGHLVFRAAFNTRCVGVEAALRQLRQRKMVVCDAASAVAPTHLCRQSNGGFFLQFEF